jgi:molybdopterin converting factor subunit 1
MVTVKFFGWAKDAAGCNERAFTFPHAINTAELWNEIGKEYPSLAGYKEKFALAVNYEYATVESVIHDGDEVAIIPPVSGG